MSALLVNVKEQIKDSMEKIYVPVVFELQPQWGSEFLMINKTVVQWAKPEFTTSFASY